MKIRDYWPTQDWQVATPESVGVEAEFSKPLESFLATNYRNINGIVIIKNGYILFEKYNNNYTAEDTHNVASVTKSVVSALIGIAIDKGLIEGVHKKVVEFFPEFSPGRGNPQVRAITLEHLLTMTAPFAWKTRGLRFEPLDRLRRQPNWIKYILDLLGRDGRLGEFQYCTAGTHLLSAIITRVTGMSAREFANIELFGPLGMKQIPDCDMKSYLLDDVFGKNVSGWIKDQQGISTGGWGLTITPRDMARFGFLYINGGLWDGIRIISEKWINLSTTPYAERYGYLWWLTGSDDNFTYLAAGAGGSHIYCVPGKDLVVAIASQITGKPTDRWAILDQYVLPMIKD